MLDATKENLKAVGKGDEPLKDIILTADANYHNNKNIAQCEEEEIDAYIPDTGFRKRDERFKEMDRFRDGVNKPPKPGKAKRDSFGIDDFEYDENKDQYICPQGKALKLQARRAPMNNGYYRVYRISDDSCVTCELKAKCLKRSTRRRFLCIKQGDYDQQKRQSYSRKMQAKIDTVLGREIYGRRIGIIEPVFGNIRYNKGLDRFTYRSKVKVNVQWLLYCMVHNIEKIAHYGMA